MLTDSQIERYSRQIVLPEVGGRGQERLLAASAAIAGGDSAAIFCAAHLAAAGVGRLHVDGIDANGPLADALALRARNLDCVIGSAPFAEADVTILLGDVDLARTAVSGTLVWGRGTAEGIIAARFPTGRGCISCLAALESPAGAHAGSAQLLGTLLATLGLRALLGIGANDRAELLRLSASASPLVSSPFPSRSECPVCS
jgi:hypothetical protein